MRFEAKHATLVVTERETIECPRRVRRLYRTAARITTVALCVPVALALFSCILHVPVLPLVLILVLVALARLLEEPVVRLMTRWLWPLHARWLTQRRPETLQRRTLRTAAWHTDPTEVEVDADTGMLRVGERSCDLARPYHLTLERAALRGPELRVRIHQPEHGTLLVSTLVPLDPRDLGGCWEALPRREGESVVLSWEEFLVVVDALREAHRASYGSLPAELEEITARATPSRVRAPS